MTTTTTTIDQALFRSVLGRFATGVTVVTLRDAAGRDHGMTVSAFSSVSLEPPLVLVCIGRDATLHPTIHEVAHFGVSVLAEGQEALSRRFASPEEDRFEGVGFHRGPAGSPLLDDALAQLECAVHAVHEAGDHTILIGRVELATYREGTGPLLYYRGGYGRMTL